MRDISRRRGNSAGAILTISMLMIFDRVKNAIPLLVCPQISMDSGFDPTNVKLVCVLTLEKYGWRFATLNS